MEKIDMDVGTQPLNEIMEKGGLSNHDLVAASVPGFITHKQVQKARKGRRLTPQMQEKVLEALNKAAGAEEPFSFRDLFNYRGKKSLGKEAS